MSSLGHIIVVDDEPIIQKMVQQYLTKEGYRVSTADGGSALRRLLDKDPADLIILDLNMPEEHGFSILAHIRQTSNAGVIILTSSDDEVNQVVGLELGSDDYVSKSSDMRQLLARVRSVLRRVKASPVEQIDAEQTVFQFDGWRLDPSARQLLKPDGSELCLTTLEFDLLSALVESAGRVLNRDQLLEITRNRDWSPYDRSVDNSISRLRQKLEINSKSPKIIKTVRGVGYVFASKVMRV